MKTLPLFGSLLIVVLNACESGVNTSVDAKTTETTSSQTSEAPPADATSNPSMKDRSPTAPGPSGVAQGSGGIVGSVMINADSTEARLLINESMMDGDLSKLFDQMKLPETEGVNKKTKTFVLKNGLFGFTCNKGIFSSAPPTTSCTFFIKQGQTENTTATIVKVGSDKAATIGMTQAVSSELAGVFPANAQGSIAYVLSLPKNVIFEVRGATWGNLTIGFSSKLNTSPSVNVKIVCEEPMSAGDRLWYAIDASQNLLSKNYVVKNGTGGTDENHEILLDNTRIGTQADVSLAACHPVWSTPAESLLLFQYECPDLTARNGVVSIKKATGKIVIDLSTGIGKAVFRDTYQAGNREARERNVEVELQQCKLVD